LELFLSFDDMERFDVSPKTQADFTNELLKQFAVGLDDVLRQRLREISGKVPHHTIQNLRYQIMEASASDISAEWHLYFQDSGRISEMKKINPGKMLPVNSILEWIKRGRERLFSGIPGYKGESRLSKGKQLERIAYAIAVTKAKGTIRKKKERKERAWVNGNVYGWFNGLIGRFIDKQTDFLKELVKTGFGQELGKV
jgi:hypothetical protein